VRSRPFSQDGRKKGQARSRRSALAQKRGAEKEEKKNKLHGPGTEKATLLSSKKERKEKGPTEYTTKEGKKKKRCLCDKPEKKRWLRMIFEKKRKRKLNV